MENMKHVQCRDKKAVSKRQSGSSGGYIKKKTGLSPARKSDFEYGEDEGMRVMVGNGAVNDSLLFFLTG